MTILQFFLFFFFVYYISDTDAAAAAVSNDRRIRIDTTTHCAARRIFDSDDSDANNRRVDSGANRRVDGNDTDAVRRIDSDDTVNVAAFNIRRFGINKVNDTFVRNIIVKIILRYDLVAIQEITDKSGRAIDMLLKEINNRQNSSTKIYKLKISPRLGRSDRGKEQYAFLYRADKLETERDYVYDERENDTYEREPYIVKWKTNTGRNKFFFTTIVIHVKPRKALAELRELHRVVEEVARNDTNSHIILLGDFNAGCRYIKKERLETIPLKKDKKYEWLINSDQDTTTTTTTDCAYDRIVITKNLSRYLVKDFPNIFRYDKEYKLNSKQALDISDHYPVQMTLNLSSKATI